jgi:MFS family permease
LVRSPLLAIFLIVAVDVLGLTIMIPLLPFYAEKMGCQPTEVGWLIGIYAACQLFSGPLCGRLSDHTGRKPLLLVSQAGTFVVSSSRRLRRRCGYVCGGAPSMGARREIFRWRKPTFPT